jgi:hypothetical protein
MPTIQPKRDRILIDLFLSAYENDSWADSRRDYLEERMDGAVEVLATRADGATLAIEHTLIEPFIGDTEDLVRFQRSFLAIEQDKSLVVPGHAIYVDVPVQQLEKHEREPAVAALHSWLKANIASLPVGRSRRDCPFTVAENRNSVLRLKIRLQPLHRPDGSLMIRRYGDLRIGEVVEKALNAKLPKLAGTEADKRILLLERNQMQLDELEILNEVDRRRSQFQQLSDVHEIWFAETVFFESEQYVDFNRYQNGDAVSTLEFHRGRLSARYENGMAAVEPES